MITIRDNIDLKEMTTFGLPARCGRLIEFSDPADLPDLDRQGLLAGAMVIGGGSNLLFTGDAPGLTVIHPTSDRMDFADKGTDLVEVTADAGVILDDLCAEASRQGIWGVENLSGIPGQIGGAAVQNVGAYGTEFKDVVTSVTCYSVKGHRFVTLTTEECRYGYRDSIFKHLPEDELMIVCNVTLRLTRKGTPTLTYAGLHKLFADKKCESPALIRDAVIAMRDDKLPVPGQTGSAGSFFKNPVVSPSCLEKVKELWENTPAGKEIPLPCHLLEDGQAKLSAAWLIDKAGCKPLTRGGAALWHKQPLVLVNATGNATGGDITALENAVIEKVKEMFHITLSPEVIHI